MNTVATPEVIAKEKPAVVIIASGGELLIPPIKGIDKSEAVFAEDVLSGKAAVGQNVLIVGGGMVGCETAHYLAEKGKTVTIVEMLKEVAGDMFPRLRWRLLDGLAEKKVTIIANCTCEEITKNSVTFTTAGGQKTVPVDTVVLAAGYKVNDTLYRGLEGKYPEVYRVGDALQVRRIIDAINDGYHIGLML